MAKSQKHTEIVSSTPRRTRVRVSVKRRNAKEMARLAAALEKHPHIHKIEEDVRTGSLLIRHSPGSLDEIRRVLIDLGVILGSTTEAGPLMKSGEAGSPPSLTDAISDLNRRFGFEATGVLNLRTFIPFGLGALAVVQLVRNGWQFGTAPWYVLAYVAVDSFIKLNPFQKDEFSDKEAVPPL